MSCDRWVKGSLNILMSLDGGYICNISSNQKSPRKEPIVMTVARKG